MAARVSMVVFKGIEIVSVGVQVMPQGSSDALWTILKTVA